MHGLVSSDAFFPHSSPLITRRKSIFAVKILVPKEVTLGCAPAPVLNFLVALLQLAGEKLSKTVSYGSLYDEHYLDFKHLHLQAPCLWEKYIAQWFQLTRKLLPPAACCGNEIKSQMAAGHKSWLARRRCCQTYGTFRGEESQDSFLVQEINLHVLLNRCGAFTDVPRKGQ